MVLRADDHNARGITAHGSDVTAKNVNEKICCHDARSSAHLFLTVKNSLPLLCQHIGKMKQGQNTRQRNRSTIAVILNRATEGARREGSVLRLKG